MGQHERSLENALALVETHLDLVYRLARRALGDPADAEDLLQEVFLKLVTDPSALAQVDDVRAWLATVTLNLARSRRRSEKRRRQREESWALERQRRDAEQKQLDAGKGSPQSWEVEEAVATLPDELRWPLVLYFQEGFKYREIARVLACPEGTVASRVATARERLRAQLSGAGALVPFAVIDSALAPAVASSADVGAIAPAAVRARLIEHVRTALSPVTGSGNIAPAHASVRPPFMTPGATAAAAAAVAIIVVAVALSVMFHDGGDDVASNAADSPHTASMVGPGGNPDPTGNLSAPTTGPLIASSGDPAAPAPASDASGTDTTAAALITGRVTDARGRLVADALVSLHSHDQRNALLSTRTDEHGEYTVQVAEEWLAATASDAGLAESLAELRAASEARNAWQREKEEQWAVDMGASRERTQRVTYEVERAPETSSPPLDGHNRTRTSTPQPQQQLKVDYRSMLELVVRATGCVTRESGPFRIEAGATERMDFELAQGEELRGRVTDRAGHPIAEATIDVVASSGTAMRPDERLTGTEDDGRFEFITLPPGGCILRASAPGYLATEVAASAGPHELLIQLTESATCEVHVKGPADAQPMVNALLLVDGVQIAIATANHDGPAILHGPAGRDAMVELIEAVPTLWAKKITLPVSGALPLTVELPDPVDITGSITLPDDGSSDPFPHLSATLHPLDPPCGAHAAQHQSQPFSISKREGAMSYAFYRVYPGRYRIELMLAGKGTDEKLLDVREVEVHAGGGDIELDLEARALDMSTLVVRPSHAGDPPLCPVAIHVLDRQSHLAVCAPRKNNDDGSISLGLYPGEYVIQMSEPGYLRRAIEVALAAGERREVQVALLPIGPADAQLTDFFAKPAPSIIPVEAVTLRSALGLVALHATCPIAQSARLETSGILDRRCFNWAGDPAPRFLEQLLEDNGLSWRKTGDRIEIDLAD